MKLLKLWALMPLEFVDVGISFLCRPFSSNVGDNVWLKLRMKMMRHQERQKLSFKNTLNTVGVLYRSLYVSWQNSLWLCVVAFLAWFFWVALFQWQKEILISLEQVMWCLVFHTLWCDCFAGFVILLTTCNQIAGLSRGSRGSSLVFNTLFNRRVLWHLWSSKHVLACCFFWHSFNTFGAIMIQISLHLLLKGKSC